jgi:hypothetical protein
MSKSHHYVPQYYLKGFSTSNDSSKIWAFERHTKKRFCTSVANIAHENYFYAFRNENGVNDTDSVEQFLANRIEGPANLVINKLRRHETINREEKQQLALYVTLMYSRVPRYRERVKDNLPQVMSEQLSLLKAQLQSAKKQQLISEPFAESIFQAVENEFEFAKREPPTPFLLPKFYQVIFEVLINMQWTFLVRQESPYFLTSDNPFVFTERRGLGDEKAEIIFPVSKDVMLWATWKTGTDCHFHPIEENVVQFANEFIAGNATRFVFYCEDAAWINEML